MKNVYRLLVILVCLSAVSFSQEKIIDISPDGSQSHEYLYSKNSTPGVSIKTDYNVPFGTQPNWVSKRDRQVGGMAFGDYDNDGDLDLAVGCYTSSSYPPINEYENMIYKNTNGVLDTVPQWISADEKHTAEVKFGDINKDGRPDLFSANGSFAKSVIYFNSETGLSTSPGWTSNDNNWTTGVAICDFDKDNDLDVAISNQGVSPNPEKPINIFMNNNGVLETTPSWASADQMISSSIAFGSLSGSFTTTSNTFTGDGIKKVFHLKRVSLRGISAVKVNNIEKPFCYDLINGWVALKDAPPAGSEITVLYDYDFSDLAASKWVNYQSAVYLNSGTSINTFPGWTNGVTGGMKGIAFADFNLDGFIDLAIGGSSSPNMIYKNNNGTLELFWQSNNSNTSVQDLIFADINADNYPDLTVVHFGYHRVDIFINRGGVIDVAPTWSYSPTSSSTAIAYGDVNGDGYLDLAIGTARQPVMLFLADPSLIPVEFVSFNADVENGKVNLSWMTATEKNNSGFNVQLLKGNTWIDLDFIKGAGTSTEPLNYYYTHTPERNGTFQYRIKQTDYDGSVTYSKPVTIEHMNNLSFEVMNNYPNPFNPSTKIKFSIASDSKVSIKVYNSLGQQISELLNEQLLAGNHSIDFNAAGLPSGIYFAKITANDFTKTIKMVYNK